MLLLNRLHLQVHRGQRMRGKDLTARPRPASYSIYSDASRASEPEPEPVKDQNNF